MKYFHHEKDIFQLTTPEYEVPVFGDQIGELELISTELSEIDIMKTVPLSGLEDYMEQNKILACTFRGKEDINIVRLLCETGFKFVGTYNKFRGSFDEFKEIVSNSNIEVNRASEEEYEEILTLEERVFDYSTFQIDPLLDPQITAYRNAVRVKSYFNNSLHRAFNIRVNKQLAGFIQFLVDDKRNVAACVNAAVDPGFQGLFIGPKLYSDAFKMIFNSGVKKINGGYSNQNPAVAKIISACHFKIVDQEIHLRIHRKS